MAPSADLDLALRSIVFAAAGTAGQRCTTLRRLIVHRSILDRVLERVADAFGRLPIGSPTEQDTLVGPLIDGASFASQQRALGRAVALKVLPAERSLNGSAILRFQHEARMASSLSHPNICTIYEIADQDGTPFIVMELLEGDVLSQVIAGQPLPLHQVITLGVQLADARNARK